MDAQPATKATPTFTERTTCRICQTDGFTEVLDLGNQFLAGWLHVKDTNYHRAPLVLVQCNACGLLQLKHSVDPDLCFKDYWYRSSVNQTMRDALAQVVLDGNHYAREGAWLDIGANDGYLLSRVGERFKKVACEPALNMHSYLEEHADHIVADYFSAEAVLNWANKFDIITSCACFYDLDDPNKFVNDIGKCLSSSGVWINQLNDAPTMLRNNIWDGICHEHLMYLSVPDIARLYEKHGLRIVGISHNDVNGGSVRVAAMKSKGNGVSPIMGVAEVKPDEVAAFADRTRRWKVLINEVLDMPAMRGTELWGYGASTKGCVMVQYGGIGERFTAIADRNPAKHGTFMTGGWIPVHAESDMRRAKPGHLFVFPWAFRKEFIERESELRRSGTRMILPLPSIEFVL